MMIDREKVVKEYEDYVNSYISLTTSHDYELEMHKAVLALLKEQEAVQVIQCEILHMHFWCCGSCGVAITEGDKFCWMCGKKVKWE